MEQPRRSKSRPGAVRAASSRGGILRRVGGLALAGLGGYLRRSWRQRRALAPQEALIVAAVAVVVGAFLLLLMQQALWLAMLVLALAVAFAWWELTRPG